MNKFFPKLSIKNLCTLGLLLAITILLAVFATFRIGTLIKVPTKFIPVFVTAAVFGPVWGGICGALGDLLNAVLAPVGPLLPQITAIEFLSGFLYGLFFMKCDGLSRKAYIRIAVLCAVAQTLVDLLLTTSVLTFTLGYFPTFETGLAFRLPAGIIKAALQIGVTVSCQGLIERIKGAAYVK